MLPRGEQRALIVLSFVLVFSLAIRIGVQLLPGREPAGLEEFEREYHALMAAMARSDSIANAASGYRSQIPAPQSPVPTPHSPIPTPKSPVPTPRSPLPTPQSPININRADSVQLLPLPGIGPVFAGRIIKYRDLLGGYISLDQLREVYGLPAETIDLIADRIAIDASSVRRIYIDSASFSELLRHPYLDLNEVKALVEYRDFKKDISSLKELIENQILEDSTIARVGPYFDLGK